MSTWEQRMSDRAKARQRAAEEAELAREKAAYEAALPYDDGLCMVGDENPRVYPTGMCQTCLDRPYGTIGGELPDEKCRRCWGDRYVWLGNAWGLSHVGPFNGCGHDCHRWEVWMAGDRLPSTPCPNILSTRT